MNVLGWCIANIFCVPKLFWTAVLECNIYRAYEHSGTRRQIDALPDVGA